MSRNEEDYQRWLEEELREEEEEMVARDLLQENDGPQMVESKHVILFFHENSVKSTLSCENYFIKVIIYLLIKLLLTFLEQI